MAHFAKSSGREPLGRYPTPVIKLEAHSGEFTELWLKDDGQTSPLYGGNKVRKLEYLLSEARARGMRRVLTFGAAGSHHVYATSLFGQRLGFEVEALLFSQPHTEHAEAMLRLTLSSGARCTPYSGPLQGALRSAHAAINKHTYLIPIGGSTPLGSLGYVEAAIELAEQILQGNLPEPDELVVPVGSGGTVSGLAVGLAACGLRTRVVGVPVMQPGWLGEASAGVLIERLRRRLNSSLPPELTARISSLAHTDATWNTGLNQNALAPFRRPMWVQKLEIDTQFTGPGYGHPTRETARTIEQGSKIGLKLDSTYTAKAFATALARTERKEIQAKRANSRDKRLFRVLYWHTLAGSEASSLSLSSKPVPTEFRQLLRPI